MILLWVSSNVTVITIICDVSTIKYNVWRTKNAIKKKHGYHRIILLLYTKVYHQLLRLTPSIITVFSAYILFKSK